MKTKIKYTAIVLLFLTATVGTLRAASASIWDTPADYGTSQNNPYNQAWDAQLSVQPFLFQSDKFYNQEMSFSSGFSVAGDFLTSRFGGLFREGIGSEGGDFDQDTTDESNPNDRNDIPMGDGLLPLMLATLGWVALVVLKRRFCHYFK
ncbi:hypothetical protein AGMMS50262_04720 [Bacteroidia bacterium]|nr:hypothetical protein AGMMS50262_04720 [Bacteroidia bacterium]